MKHLRHRAALAALPLLVTAPGVGYAQPTPPTQAEAQAALTPAPAPFTPAQLDQMLAPIALYPDSLLTELLMAATFPQQVIDAQAWLQDPKNAALTGDPLVAALQPQPWDPSVKSLVAFPQIIAMMNEHLDWAEALGTAFANQEVQTLARVQFLRDQAVAAGQLKSTAQLTVQKQANEIVIAPANPAMIYVPVYNPAVVYGTWPDAGEPPVYIPPPPGFYNGEIGAGIAFSIGFGVAAPLWGWSHPNWSGNQVVVDPTRYQQITTSTATTQNHVSVTNDVWERTAPVVPVPAAQRPRPTQPSAPLPEGTVRSSAVAHPVLAPAPHPGETPPAAAHPPAAPTPAHPEVAPAETHPPAAPSPAHPEAQPAETHPPATPTPAHPEAQPAETHPPAAPAPHPAAPAEAHPPAAPTHPEAQPAETHPPAAPSHPPAAAPAHPAPAPQKPAPQKPAPKPGEEEKPEQH